MIRAVAIGAATLAAAGSLAWLGSDLLSLPRQHSGVAESIVGGADARRFDAALRLFQASAASREHSDAAFVQRARAEAALAAQHGPARLRSQAQTLLGVLALQDALAQPKHATEITAAAADAFRTALRLEPDNEEAAVDLELLLTRARQHQSGSHRANGPGRGQERSRKGRERHVGSGADASTGNGGGY
jgi:hypothetical protein